MNAETEKLETYRVYNDHHNIAVNVKATSTTHARKLATEQDERFKHTATYAEKSWTNESEIVDVDAVKEEIFKSTPKHIVADIIAKNYPNARVTEKLIESYVDLALTKPFTLDKTIHEIRKLNTFDVQYEGMIEFVLDDNSHVLVSEETYSVMCESINNNDHVNFMRKNKDNFMNVVDLIRNSHD